MAAAGPRLLAYLADNAIKRGAERAVDAAVLRPLARITVDSQALRGRGDDAGLPLLIARSGDPDGITAQQVAALEALKGGPGNLEGLKARVAAGEFEAAGGLSPTQVAVEAAARSLLDQADDQQLHRAFAALPPSGSYGLTKAGSAFRQFGVPAAGYTALLGGAGVGAALAAAALMELLGQRQVEDAVVGSADSQGMPA